MNLRDLLSKQKLEGITFHSESQDIDIGVLPDQSGVIVRESSTKATHFHGPYHGEQQIRLLLEEYECKTDNFNV